MNWPFLIVQFSVRENLLVVTGNSETKELKDMLPDILKQVGPQQLMNIKDLISKMGKIPEGKAGEEDEDDVPELVGNFDDASKKWGSDERWDEVGTQQCPLSYSNIEDLIGAKDGSVGKRMRRQELVRNC